MSIFLFLLSVSFLLGGHYFKVLRWEQFIEIYERTRYRSLFSSLGWGYLLNFIFPFRIGDFVRSILAGRKMKNGFGFALATVILDRMFDVVVVGTIFFTLYFLGYRSDAINASVHFYYVFIGILFLIFLLLRYTSKWLKKIAKAFCSIFNPRIELSFLLFFWSIICTFTDIIRVNKGKLFLNTLLMWSFYLASYFSFGLFLKHYFNSSGGFLYVFVNLFAHKNLEAPLFSFGYFDNSEVIFTTLFHVLPVLGLFIISLLPKSFKNIKKEIERDYINLLPHITQEDRLKFLETFFTDQRKDYLSKFVEINKRVNVLQDYSAGSNATTLLCMDTEKTFYRKYTFGSESGKLYEQLIWLKKNEHKLPLPLIINEIHSDGLCSYDMEYKSSAVVFFNFIHSNPVEKSWNILSRVLDAFYFNLHVNTVPSSKENISSYIDNKVSKNIAKIVNGKEIKYLLEYDELIINGRAYKNIYHFEQLLSKKNLLSVFEDDVCCEIHGDLTVENIICDTDTEAVRDFYIIDPNGGNIHNSLFLDYAKLLQSLHGGYEFMMKTQNVSIDGNRIDFIFTKSLAYFEIFNRLVKHMKERFGEKGVRSIFYHEIIHWLRLMPYKLEKNGKRAIIFYAGLIMVLNDVENGKA